MKKDYLIRTRGQALIVLLFSAVLFLGGAFSFTAESLAADLNEAAPEFQLSDLSGKNVALSNFKGKPAILFIWATWCRYCRVELDHLGKSYQDIQKSGVELLAISSGEPKERVNKYLKNKKVDFPVLLDTDSRVSYAYNVIGIPTLVLVDSQGKIKFQGNNLPDDYLQILSQK